MKKLYLLKLVFCSLCCGVALSACTEDNEDTALAKLSITPTDTTLYVGDSFQYKTQVVPQKLQESVGWKCSDESVLSITPNGVVTALKEGDVTVSAFGKAFKNLALAKVHVKQGIPVKNVLLPEEGFKVFLGEPLKLQLKVEPENANVLDFQYAIEQPNLASVSTEGVIQPKAVGNTTLLVKIREKTYSCPLQIRDHIKIRNTNFHLVVGAQFLLDYDNNYAKGDQPHAVLDITVANKDVLLGISETKPLFMGVAEGKTLLTLSAPYAEAVQEIQVSYPQSLFPAFTTWDATPEEVAQWEKDHAGTKQGELQEDSEREEYVLNYKVQTNQEQPIPLRVYGFTKEGANYKLSTSSVYYPYLICFEDRGGGFGNFNQPFLALLEREGFGKPELGAPNTFFAINKAKKLTLIITTEVVDNMPMIVLNYKPKLW